MSLRKTFFKVFFLSLVIFLLFNQTVIATERAVKISVLAFNTSSGIRSILENVTGIQKIEIPRDPNTDYVRMEWYKAIITFDDEKISLEKIIDILKNKGHEVVGKVEFIR